MTAIMAGRRRCGCIILAGLLTGCASAEPALYRLVAMPGQQRQGGPARIEWRGLRLARALDQPGIPRVTGATRLVRPGGERWDGPLDGMLSEVLLRNLALRLPGSLLIDERDTGAQRPDAVLQLSIDRFEGDGEGQALLSAGILLRYPDRPDLQARADERAMPAGPGTDALVLALSETLGLLADRLAALLST